MSSKVKPTQEELIEEKIKVRMVKNVRNGDITYINMKDLRKGLTYRKGHVFIQGIFIPISKLRQWLIQAIKDSKTGRIKRKDRIEHWAILTRQDSTVLANSQIKLGPSMSFRLPKKGSLEVTGTFLSDIRYPCRYVHEVELV